MKIVANASPSVLEAELLDRVAASKSGDPLARVLIIVPSRRLADHVAHRLVERFGSILGVSVLHHRALAERVLEAAGVAPRHVLGDELLATLFVKVMQRAGAGRLRDFVRDHPGASSALRDTLTDLREAGVDPIDVTAALSGSEAETAFLYARWSAALDELARHGGAIDEPGLARAASAVAMEFAAGFVEILHHGAYDLIGVRVDLVRALDRGREITFLLPADPADASGAFGVDRARVIAGSRASLTSLERELPPAPVGFFHAQGARAELQTAAYEALSAVASGMPPHEVAIVVRAFGPYAAALDALFDARGPQWHTSYTQPLRRDPVATKALRAIASGEDRGPRGFHAHADEFETMAHQAGACDELSRLLTCLREVETVLGETRMVSRKEALDWLDASVDAATHAPDGADGGGVRILDAMQARGLTFAHVGLAGMNTGSFPRVAREDPFLCDTSRKLLREATGRPLPLAAESEGEERLLVEMLLRQARGRLRVSWRRADDAARPLVPSLALGQVARFAKLGADDISREARSLPAHPRSRLEAWASSPGLIPAREETVLVALASETGADAGPAVVARRPELDAGVALVASTETFAPTTGAYDGRIDASVSRDSMAATALETLGRCPLQFFFRHVLHVNAPRTPPTPFESDAASIGSRVHDVLREVFSRLREEGAFEGSGIDDRVLRARELLRDAWTRTAGEADVARGARLPVLVRIESQLWTTALDAFLDTDLRRMAREGFVPDALELDVKGPIPSGPRGLVVNARFDRVMRSRDGAVVADYKTGRELKHRVRVGAMLSGAALQVPIYALISGLPVELLAVGPNPDVDVIRFESFNSEEQRIGFLETLRIVAALNEAGRFPIRPGSHCERCDYRSACRRGHPPTEYREDHAADIQDARDCWSKTGRLPTIAAVREVNVP